MKWLRSVGWLNIAIACSAVFTIAMGIWSVADNISTYEAQKQTCDMKNGEMIVGASGHYLCIERGVLK